jgi:hypothetical protein
VPGASDSRSPYELLVERILSVALRLRYPWVQDYTEEKLDPALKGMSDVSVRIGVLMHDIEETIFPAPAR